MTIGRPLSAQSQEIIDIVRAHGPIDLNGICKRVTLLQEREDIAATLYRLRDGGHLLRKSDRTYLVNGRNAGDVTNESTPAVKEPLTADEPHTAPQSASTGAELPEELLQQLSKEGRREVENGTAGDVGPQAVAGTDQSPSPAPAPKKSARREMLFKTETVAGETPQPGSAPAMKPPLRIEDLESPAVDSRIVSVLEKAANDAQANLDAFIREAGDLAVIMATLVENRDRARDVLNNYRRTEI